MDKYKTWQIPFVFIIREAINRGETPQRILPKINKLVTDITTEDERNKFKRILSRIWNIENDKR